MSNPKKLQELRESLHPGEPLDDVHWLEIVRILDDLAQGYDTRELYGIKPKPGKRPAVRGMHKWMVLHYLALREEEPAQAMKVHRGQVAIAWGKTDNDVRKLIEKHSSPLADAYRGTTVTAILDSVVILQAAYKKNHRP